MAMIGPSCRCTLTFQLAAASWREYGPNLVNAEAVWWRDEPSRRHASGLYESRVYRGSGGGVAGPGVPLVALPGRPLARMSEPHCEYRVYCPGVVQAPDPV